MSTNADDGPRGSWRRCAKQMWPSILMVGLILVARSTLADHYHVPSGSMEHTLRPGDHVLVNKAAYGLRIPFTTRVVALAGQPHRGEVVIFDSPEDGERLIKRVVALGGDSVAIRRGRVFINGQALADTEDGRREIYGLRSAWLNLDHGGGPGLKGLEVPVGYVLVLGDHRGNSRDGRYFGVIPVSQIYGRASGVFWRSGRGALWQPL